jgi:hypothetical protein
MANRLVLDNSVVMAWCFRDVEDGYADAVLESMTETEALVPASGPLRWQTCWLPPSAEND